MKRVVSYIAIIAMAASMVSCGEKNTDISAKKTSLTTTTASGANSAQTVTTSADGVSTGAVQENNATVNEVSDNVTPINKSDLNLIIGTWHEENAFDPRTLTVYDDGTYMLEYGSGGYESGNVKVEYFETGNGEQSIAWYYFYRLDKTKWADFRLALSEGTSPRLCAGFDPSAMSFVASGGITESPIFNSHVTADDFIGTWSTGRYYININSNGDGTYAVNVSWKISASEGCTWDYTCTFDDMSLVLTSNGTGTCTEYAYSEDGSCTSSERYTNGFGVFYFSANGNLMWDNYTDNMSGNMEFYRI